MDLFEAVLWLALNLYHEARSENLEGKKAVVHVVMNRAAEDSLTIKEVILEPMQFSWVHQLDVYTPKEFDAFLDCLSAVKLAVNEYDFTLGATHYHLDTVSPYWNTDMQYIGKFGSHLFYKQYRKNVTILHAGKYKVKPTKEK